MEKKSYSTLSKKIRYINIKTPNQPGSAIVANQMIKTKLCIDHQTKGCIRGDQCPYAHSVTEMRSLPDLRKTKICSLILSGKGCKNKACRYAHSDEELRSTCKFAEYRTRVCRFAKNQGGRGCLYGDRCPYAHSTEELRATSDQAAESVTQDKLGDCMDQISMIDEKINTENTNENKIIQKDTNAMHVIDGKRPIVSTKTNEMDNPSHIFRKPSDSSLPKMLSKSKRATTLAKMEEQEKIPSYPQSVIYPKDNTISEDEILSILSNPIPSRELAYEQLLLEKFKQNWEINSKAFYTFMQNRLYLYNLLYSKDIIPITIKQCAIEKLCKDLQAYLYKNDTILLPTREKDYLYEEKYMFNKSDKGMYPSSASNNADLLKQSQRY